jgi:hypothetical protein
VISKPSPKRHSEKKRKKAKQDTITMFLREHYTHKNLQTDWGQSRMVGYAEHRDKCSGFVYVTNFSKCSKMPHNTMELVNKLVSTSFFSLSCR